MKRCYRKILVLSSLALMIALAPASTQQSKAQVQAAIKAAAQAAVDKAVAQKEGELAAQKALLQEAEAEKGRQALKAGLWRGVGLSAVGEMCRVRRGPLYAYGCPLRGRRWARGRGDLVACRELAVKVDRTPERGLYFAPAGLCHSDSGLAGIAAQSGT